jgi:non-canonical (house-cleaning) NTP pyrophosphatase
MMEEVGHEGEEEHVAAVIVSSAGHADESVILDALQDAAQTFVPEGSSKELPAATATTIAASNIPGTAVGTTTPGSGLVRPVAPAIPALPDMSSVTNWTPSSPAVPTWTATSLPSVPVNLSTPPRQLPVYQQTPTVGVLSPPVVNPAGSGLTAVGTAPPPPPTGGFVPAHGIVTATPGKHHSSLPMAQPESLPSHLFTPSAVDTSQSPQLPSSAASYSSYAEPVITSVPADYGLGLMHTSYESSQPTYPVGMHVDHAPPTSPQKSERFFGWLPGSGLMHKVIEKTKSSVESVITTLDPGMKDVIYSGGSVNVIVTSAKEVKVSAIRQAFQSVFGRATVFGVESQPNIAPQPVGYSAGVRGAEERIENLRQSGTIDEQQTIVSVENFLVELLPDRWFDMGCILLKDPRYGIELMTFSQATPVPSEYVCVAQDATTPDYPLRWSGFAMTVGQAIHQRLPHIDPTDWHVYLTGMSRRDMLVSAAHSLAGMYRTQLPHGTIL